MNVVFVMIFCTVLWFCVDYGICVVDGIKCCSAIFVIISASAAVV